MGLVSFDIVKGNPGALTFLMNAYDLDMFAAEKGFKRMEKAGITGSWLYMLWNDCCNRDTEKAIKAMNEIDIEVIKDHVYRPRGLPFAETENNFSRITESPEALAEFIAEDRKECHRAHCSVACDGCTKEGVLKWLKQESKDGN